MLLAGCHGVGARRRWQGASPGALPPPSSPTGRGTPKGTQPLEQEQPSPRPGWPGVAHQAAVSGQTAHFKGQEEEGGAAVRQMEKETSAE